ncbi:hypothetical protein TGPRC2_273830 [Toxoplasma gondii TgCatPRC2]|uniref:Uncharacterized protein n=15 Tax=Toxoplasma gondii TaxID=5811 RepID=B9PG13_TOXGV|nr:hypothetical protein TGME49_273830 [Toxoplasma gondii ME49]EPR64563.1 hypothetical protein TGGT1_273830 [Toxoplasma gondii GT1]ESS36033.1 hypothetical protein TGVEG_273830 [Toxoplasma gondii VEG]KAF4642010.1 hypothetical protein TGRH88_078220 [Toxoplasma gondii]KFG49067.1 hypothetical protein TGDOM2_273830 [Toxoplasma gondii GAB2-2007-GAL-DOM2]KFG51584.1 hypothetical protein TGP89_273830 [Toxoplasma gondii p89]KFG63993.1 hypothetical protein TGRUB_273830 [Toxoplasma gondii RUB]KFH11573.1 |eukprot:XP_002365984.1 hypothetical protein TGME49_273830 [Toxoplasma gondii ME49]
MSLRTPALPEDFAYFPAWYGRVPSFVELADSSHKLSCAEEWFSWRVANLNSLYLTSIHHADHQLARVWLEGLDDVMFCHALKRMPLAERPGSMQQRFRIKYPLNDVWTYRQLPPHA